MVKVKICGITNTSDALTAASRGAWALGFIFYKKSPRYVSPFKAKKIIDELPPFITPVGVFVDQREGAVKDIAKFCGLNTLQFHGDESPQYCRRFGTYKIIKAFRVRDGFDFKTVEQYHSVCPLFDTYEENSQGGTGKAFNWNDLRQGFNIDKPYILSGGLHALNVQTAVRMLRPYAIDLSSGVEKSPGKKDPRLLKQFFDILAFDPQSDQPAAPKADPVT